MKNKVGYVVKIFLLVCLTTFMLIDYDSSHAKRVMPNNNHKGIKMLTYLSTDKPIYREKEKVYLRAVALEANTNFPVEESHGVIFEIKGPKGDVITKITTNLQDSVAGSAWEIPEGQAGGEYKVVAQVGGSAKTERTFDIRAYQPPRLKTQIEFLRKGYGPGDNATATVNVIRAEGGIPLKAKVTAIARIDGLEVFRKQGLSIDEDGNCSTSFDLPAKIEVGDGTLSFLIEDGGVVETASKTIPILLQSMDIAFYPEGGELVANLNNKVYIQANRPDGKPADIAGVIIEIDKVTKKVVNKLNVEVETKHEGRGYFNFIPKANAAYTLKLNKPSGIEKQFTLPDVISDGVVFSDVKNTYEYDDKIKITINSSKDSQAKKITLSKRKKELDKIDISVGQENTVTLNPEEAEGVLIVTVWDDNSNPIAERLIFRKPKFAVNIKITPEAEEFVPGGKVKVNVETTDENGSPISAVVSLSITDESVLEMIDKREQAPSLPVMVYLENEVDDLADAEVYFDSNNPDADRDIDLLLGTQGWRRFILVKYDDIKKTYKDAADRVLAVMQPEYLLYNVNVRRKLRMRGGEPEIMEMAPPAAGADQDVVDALDEGAALNKGVQEDDKAAIVGNAVQPVPVDEPMKVKEEIADEEVLAPPVVMAKKLFARQDIAMEAPMPNYVIIREYSHKVRQNRKPNDRTDFTETVYWNAGVKTNPRNGKATVEFDLSDSITSFKVNADAFGNNGALGNSVKNIESLEPFYIEPKLPNELTVGDKINLPINLVNSTNKTLSKVKVIVKGKGLIIKQPETVELKAKERKRVLVEISADKTGDYQLTINAAAGNYSDNVTRKLSFEADGFPMAINAGGLISSSKSAVVKVIIPEKYAPASVKTKVKVYPTPLANMEEALNALLRQPHGCFEQTSSTNYPLVMAQQYFTSHQGIPPEKIKEAQDLLEKGYKRLVGFEAKKKGYEWFGSDPAHEALTAYGLMEFTDMSKFMPIDQGMLDRTKEWLLSRRDGKGGFKRNERALDSFGRAPVPTTNAYILWSLLESGESSENLKKEIEAIKKESETTKDSYVLALAANIMYLANDPTTGNKISEKLVKLAEKDGSIGGGLSTITSSGGESLEIETTSLAILAFLKSQGKFAANVETSMKWLFEKCKSGRFGSTQSTILALKAINAYDKARAKPKAPGSVQLVINGEAYGKPVKFDKDTKGAIELPDFSAKLDSGEHTVKLVMTDGSEMPYSLGVEYKTTLPASSDKTNLRLDLKLSTNKVNEGEPIEANIVLKVLEKDAPTPIAIIGIPSGLEPRHDQLKELVGADRISSYEVIGRNIVLYWRALKANTELNIPLSLVARIPGKYKAPASSAYLYYTDEFKQWVDGVEVEVIAK